VTARATVSMVLGLGLVAGALGCTVTDPRERLLAVGEGGVSVSVDGGESWQPAAGRVDRAGRLTAVARSDDVDVVAGERDGRPALWTSSDDDKTWVPVTVTDAPGDRTGAFEAVACRRRRCAAASSSGLVAVSETGGVTWRALPALPDRGTVTAVAVVPSAGGPVVVARRTGEGDRAARIDASGEGPTWSATPFTAPATVAALIYVRSELLAVGRVGDRAAVLRSVDGGRAWGSGAAVPDRMAGLAVLASDGQGAVAADMGAAVSSDDAGARWTDVAALPDVGPLAGMALAGPAAVAVGRGGAVAASSDGGASWHPASGAALRGPVAAVAGPAPG
jgi:photosystem II stability/assembly factor-like uncharacterized protein